MHRTILNAAGLRVLIMLAAAITLGACAQSSVQDDPLAAAAPPPPAVPDAASAPAAPRVVPAGRNTSAPYAPPPAAATPRLSIEAARGECWMKLESDRKAPRDLDMRVALVETCAADKMAHAAKEAERKAE